MRAVYSSAEYPVHPSSTSGSGLTLVEPEMRPGVRPVGVSTAWRKLLMQVDMVAPYVQLATFEGECGSGKHTLARYLYSRSPLAGNGFQRHDARKWLAEDADLATLKGVLYLDRVDLLAPVGQGLLLNFLKTLQDRPAGRLVVLVSSQTSLRQMAAQGLFLPDLAFRLTAVRFAIPPLRKRKEDITVLTQALLGRFCRRYQQCPVTLGVGALPRLLQHHWPGNVRELASVLESALLEAVEGVIRPGDLTLPAERDFSRSAPLAGQANIINLDAVIQRHVLYVLDLNRGNKLRTAHQLGISRSTLYRILDSNKAALAR